MINKCKVEMIGEELYNVKESLREGDEKKLYEEQKGIESGRRVPFLCFPFSVSRSSMH